MFGGGRTCRQLLVHPTPGLYVADCDAGMVGQGDGMDPGSVVEVESGPHPVVGPPVAAAPGMVTLAGSRDDDLLAVYADRSLDAAGDFVPCGRTPLIGCAVGEPAEVEA